MKKIKFDEKMTNLIIDEDKVREKNGFRYGRFTLRWFQLNVLAYAFALAGFFYSHHLFDTSFYPIMLPFYIYFLYLATKNSIQFYLMNRNLGALKHKWMAPFFSFFIIGVTLIYAITTIIFENCWPLNEVFQDIKLGCFLTFLIIIPLNFWLILFWYVSPVMTILDELYRSKGANPFGDGF